MSIYLRSNSYHLRKRVPLRFRQIEEREIVGVSLKTDSPRLAKRKADEVWNQLLEGWEAALRGDAAGAQARYRAARNVAAHRGVDFVAAPILAAGTLEEIVTRVQNVPFNRDGSPNQRIGDAVLGAIEEPGLTIEGALDEFWRISIDAIRGKTEDQVRRWKNPRLKAIRNLVGVIGNKPLRDLTRADMSRFRDWWNEKIAKEGLTANSAQKDFTHIAHTLRVVDDSLGLELNLPVGGLKIKAGEKGKRVPFSDKWIKEKLLADSALDGMNVEAKTILLTLINTGARPSEVAGLMKRHIHLDGKVPHIEILPEGRELKNAASKRHIPLVGVSLKAIKAYMDNAPEGEKAFPTYFGKDKLSDAVNKFLREGRLMESDKHTLYGLRHAFEDRMTAAEPAWPERMKCDVFGHALSRQRYGDGASMEHIHRRLKEIAL